MELSINERLLILSILPKEGNILTLRIVRDLAREVGFSEEELKDWEIKQEGNNVSWNSQKVVSKDIKIGDAAKKVISDEMKKLEKENKLQITYLDLFEKFTEE